jgi:hypothetical protein
MVSLWLVGWIALAQADPEPLRPDQFGSSLAPIGDVDGDGVPDAAIGASLEGVVRVFSGAEGALLFQVAGEAVAPLGDVNGDGRADIIVSPSGWTMASGKPVPEGTVRAVSGHDGAVLWVAERAKDEHFFGAPAVGVGDVDADGLPDVALGARTSGEWYHEPGRVRVLSGVDGSELYRIESDQPSTGFGLELAGGGDLNGDGHADLLVSAAYERPHDVEARSGKDGSLLYRVEARGQAEDADEYVYGLVSLSDLDGDRVRDFAVGTSCDFDAEGCIRLVSGRTGEVLFTWDAVYVWSAANAGDVDGDGTDDLVTGRVNFPTRGGATVYSGRTREVLHRFKGKTDDRYLGYSVAGAGDMNGDGHADLLLGACSPCSPNSPGYVQWRDGADGSLLFEARVEEPR